MSETDETSKLPGPQELFQLLRSDGGVEALMKQPVYENADGRFSQAELMADVINILRMDTKQLAATHDVDVEVEKITPEKTAWVLSQMVDGETEPIISIFNEIEENHHDVLSAVMDGEGFEGYLDFKESELYTVADVEESYQPIEEVREELPEPDDTGEASSAADPEGESPEATDAR
jgi:hypothetical protein